MLAHPWSLGLTTGSTRLPGSCTLEMLSWEFHCYEGR